MKSLYYLPISIFLFSYLIPREITAQKIQDSNAHTKALIVATDTGTVTHIQKIIFLVRTNSENSYPEGWIKNLGNGWFIVKNNQDFLRIHSQDTGLRCVFPANNLWKPDNELLESYRSKTLVFPFKCIAWTMIQGDSPLSAVQDSSAPHAYPFREFTVSNISEFENLLNNDSLVSIELLKPRKAKPESIVQRYDRAANGISFSQRRYPGIKGTGLTVSVKENRFDTADVDLKSRWFLTSYTSQTMDLHATEISTLLAGSGNTGTLGKGVAPGVTLTSASFEELMPEPPAYFKANRITVQNHSYGTGIENVYATDAAAYDLLCWMDSGLVHIFSAGNQGNGTPPTGTYAGLAGFNNLTGSFKMSKNSLAVGATDSFSRVETLSSKGPAYDGRIKPELVAFGIDGTSGAAALASGTALLLQQALKDQTGVPASASLVKALLIGSATDIGSEGPDYLSGYGKLDAYGAVNLVKNQHFFTGFAETGKESLFELNIPPNTRKLKVTLTWTDTAAAPSSAIALVNDLDLSLENANGTQFWQPWILSRFPHPDSLLNPAIRGSDHINNTEQIGLNNPAAGIYRVKVAPYRLATRRQPFSLVYSLQPSDTFFCTYPSATDPVPATTTIPIRWQQTFDAGTTLKIEYAFINQPGWQTIASSANAATGYYYWTIPDTNAVARLRFTIAGNTYFSDSIFITGNPKPTPGYVCEDASLLVWRPLKGVAKYNVYTLGDTLMQKVGTTTDTIYILPASTLKNQWVGLSAEAGAGSGLETGFPTFNIFSQGIGCYFKSFLAEWNNGEANLSISLGTTYGIQSLTIQKTTGSGFSNLQTISPVSLTDYAYTDRPLTEGAHTYKVVLRLLDGKEIESELQTIIQPNASGWWVYPNPVKRGSPLKILNRWSETSDFFVEVYDLPGRKTGTRLIPLIDNTIPVTNLAAGMYFLVFTDGKKQLGTQKLVVLP